jgi:hypothetical protein
MAGDVKKEIDKSIAQYEEAKKFLLKFEDLPKLPYEWFIDGGIRAEDNEVFVNVYTTNNDKLESRITIYKNKAEADRKFKELPKVLENYKPKLIKKRLLVKDTEIEEKDGKEIKTTLISLYWLQGKYMCSIRWQTEDELTEDDVFPLAKKQDGYFE